MYFAVVDFTEKLWDSVLNHKLFWKIIHSSCQNISDSLALYTSEIFVHSSPNSNCSLLFFFLNLSLNMCSLSWEMYSWEHYSEELLSRLLGLFVCHSLLFGPYTTNFSKLSKEGTLLLSYTFLNNNLETTSFEKPNYGDLSRVKNDGLDSSSLLIL